MGRLSDFRLTGSDGRPFSSRDMRGRIWVVDFIYTTCQAACPRMSREMTKVQEALGNDDSVRLVSISVDPEHDTPPVLAAFGKRYKARPGRWFFLTGNKQVVRRLQREASIDMDPQLLEQSHNKCFILVDAHGNIRGSYESDPPETAQLLADIRMLQRNPTLPTPID
jgi:protein SCO1/2